jgi:hypothetical protein
LKPGLNCEEHTSPACQWHWRWAFSQWNAH